jgi:electron transport complex protein RnfB
MSSLISVLAIDALLPQTQCGKCGHPGCKPYAEGIAAGEAINKCPPGGEATIDALAQLLRVPVLPPEQPPIAPQVAFIREAECIGCTKCIQACPVDAIVGAAKLMHTVIADECTGCDLCVAPCPVDCIDLIALPEAQAIEQRQRADHFRRRHESHLARLQRDESRRVAARAERQAKPAATMLDPVQAAIERVKAQKAATVDDGQKRLKIEAAMAQVAYSKAQRQLATYGTLALEQQVEALRLAAVAAQAAVQTVPSDDSQVALKKAKITLAVARAALKTGERDGADLAPLQAALRAAEQALHQAENACNKPAPILQRIDKRPIDSQSRALKTELAYARAEVSKLERQQPVDDAALATAKQRLHNAEARLNAYHAP